VRQLRNKSRAQVLRRPRFFDAQRVTQFACRERVFAALGRLARRQARDLYNRPAAAPAAPLCVFSKCILQGCSVGLKLAACGSLLLSVIS